MKLITHNMLTSRCLKGVVLGYPLKIEAELVEKCEVDFNPEFVQRILPKITWNVLQETAKKFDVDLPIENPMPMIENCVTKNVQIPEDICKKIHHALFEIEIVNGNLVCPETGTKFSISKGIPNMLCNEDKV